MKRKVVQHGPSTLIVSLPAKWIKRHHIVRGDELDVSDEGDAVIISSRKIEKNETIELDISDFGGMIARTIHAAYKRGADKIILHYKDHDTFLRIQESLGKEAVGFEVLETGENYCVIKNVAEGAKEFHQVLRQTFMLLLSMAEEGEAALRKGKFSAFESLISLEIANNRFTTFCRRYLNTKGDEKFDKTGPIYYIVEELEKIADTYKYLYHYLSDKKQPIEEINTPLLDLFVSVNLLLRKFYTLFYKFNAKELADIKAHRNGIVETIQELLPKMKKPREIVVLHYLWSLEMMIFNLLDPFIILVLKDHIVAELPSITS